MTKKIAIIIPVHNSLGFTRECLDTLVPLTKEATTEKWCFDIVVMDDGSTDGTTIWVSENHPEVHLLEGCGNLWWSGGTKKGMQYALHTLKSDYILWWNNDIYPAPDYFTRLTALLENTDDATVYGSKIYKAEAPGVIWAYGGLKHRKWGHFYLYGMDAEDGTRFEKAMEADWLPGMGTLLPRKVVWQTGELNDRDFPQYHGDVDYTCRVRLAGFRIVVDPSLRIWNHTRHSGRSHENKFNRLLPNLRDIKSLDHFGKEWLLYRKYARNPLAYMMLMKKYVGYFAKFLAGKVRSLFY